MGSFFDGLPTVAPVKGMPAISFVTKEQREDMKMTRRIEQRNALNQLIRDLEEEVMASRRQSTNPLVTTNEELKEPVHLNPIA